MSAKEDQKSGTHILYVVIDCEGLFSIKRVIEEELQLVLVSVGVSDLTIFNSNKNFDRDLKKFFERLTKRHRDYASENYYNGEILFLVRDIRLND